MSDNSLTLVEDRPEREVRIDVHPDWLCASSRHVVKQRVADAIADGHRRLALSLSGVQFADSSGLGALLSCARAVERAGGEFRLVDVDEDLWALMTHTHLDTVLHCKRVGSPEGV